MVALRETNIPKDIARMKYEMIIHRSIVEIIIR